MRATATTTISRRVIKMGRITDKKGMSIIEILSAIIVIILLTAVLVTGVRLGVKAYTKSVSMSEAQILCTTLTTVVSDELRYTGTIYLDSEGNVTRFFIHNKGEGSFGQDAEGHVTIGGESVLSKSSYPYGLKAEVAVAMDASKEIFNVAVTVRSKTDHVLSGNSFQVKPIMNKDLKIEQQSN